MGRKGRLRSVPPRNAAWPTLHGLQAIGVPVAALRAALAHPAAAPIVATLVWHDPSGRHGLLDQEGLNGPQGKVTIVGDRLWVAHPNRLLELHGVGQLADYRIDLASCRVYFEPGGHLCLIPEALLAREEVLLPYAEEDLKTADLLRKAMLLMNDSKIKAADFRQQVALNGRN